MRNFWLIISLVPTAFLFHYYEYGQHIKHEEAKFLLQGSILFVLVAGVLAGSVKFRHVLLANIVSTVLSVFLASYFIADDGGWFKPVGRDMAVIFCSVVFLIGQLFVRLFSRRFFMEKEFVR
ncbi:hypothetical protein JOC25_000488 [Solibacillus kalamii]|uniref:Uncharacterized protein n=1 Tax=Solibacillus kalamii TaxID=1748298 RepID=A0ABX3ZKC3_9BACL|nr:hypothetical protein [Solibacillus kalamii]MBM7664032.1 hypothetical protein [Solibacillus kalamii]OUZ40190.1 hypothetical protein CBM15_06655 [Solibacillus kalamii]